LADDIFRHISIGFFIDIFISAISLFHFHYISLLSPSIIHFFSHFI